MDDTIKKDNQFMSEIDLAFWLSISTRDVVKMVKAGQIPCHRLPSGAVIFERDEIAEWVRSCRVAMPAESAVLA